jgi:hypothetical protein
MSLITRVKRVEKIAKPRIEQIGRVQADLDALFAAEAAIRAEQHLDPSYVPSSSEADILYRAEMARTLIEKAKERMIAGQQPPKSNDR